MNENKKLPSLWKQKIMWNLAKLLNVNIRIYPNRKNEEVWKEEFFKADNTVTVHITNLREKIEADSKAPVYIKTIWGAGYKI